MNLTAAAVVLIALVGPTANLIGIVTTVVIIITAQNLANTLTVGAPKLRACLLKWRLTTAFV